MTAVWLRWHAADTATGAAARATLELHVQPGARSTEVTGTHGDALKLRLAAPPVDGKANAALIDFLARRLGLPKASIRLVSGQSARRKRLEITDAPPDTEQRLLSSAPF